MQSFIPPEEVGNIYTLLAVIADPKAAKERLDKIVAEKAAAQALHDDAVEVSKKASADKEDAAIILADAKKLAAKEAQLDAREKALIARGAALDERESSLDQVDKQLTQRMKAHSDAVADHEKDVKQAKADLAAKLAASKSAADELDRKTSEFNKLMAPVMAATRLVNA